MATAIVALRHPLDASDAEIRRVARLPDAAPGDPAVQAGAPRALSAHRRRARRRAPTRTASPVTSCASTRAWRSRACAAGAPPSGSPPIVPNDEPTYIRIPGLRSRGRALDRAAPAAEDADITGLRLSCSSRPIASGFANGCHGRSRRRARRSGRARCGPAAHVLRSDARCRSVRRRGLYRQRSVMDRRRRRCGRIRAAAAMARDYWTSHSVAELDVAGRGRRRLPHRASALARDRGPLRARGPPSGTCAAVSAPTGSISAPATS